MDTQLQELLDRIKREGVAEAEKQAEEIVKAAEVRAEAIVVEARDAAQEMQRTSEMAAKRFEEASVQAVRNAARDLILALRGEIVKVFEELLRRQTADALDPATLQRIIAELVQAWAGQPKGATEILLSEADYETCRAHFDDVLAGELRSGLTISPSADIKSGFRVSENDGTVFVDFTDEGISEHLATLLSPRIGEIVRTAARSEQL